MPIAASFVDSPATNLVNGLIKGFLKPKQIVRFCPPACLFGGQAFSALLPGGDRQDRTTPTVPRTAHESTPVRAGGSI
jgi:hypothetical protein